MSALEYTVIDLDFPVGSPNKTATLITGDQDAVLVDAGFTRADGHRLAAAVLDSGKTLTAIVVSHADPDFYWGLEVLVDANPDAVVLATPLVAQHIAESYEAKLGAWASIGVNRPTRLVETTPLVDGLDLEGHRFELRGAPQALPDRAYLWQAEDRVVVGGVLLFEQEHVWTADTATPALRAAWIEVLDEVEALDPLITVPGHRLPGLPLGTAAIAHTRDYLRAFEDVLTESADGAAATAALVARYPDAGMLIAAQIGPKVAKGEMTWG